MTTTNKPGKTGAHLFAGPGGARAIVATTGMLMALDFFGYRSYATLGGVSGGSIPVRLYAAGVSVRRLVELTVELDFESLLDPEMPMKAVMFEHYWRSASRLKDKLPERGCCSGARFAEWVEKAGPDRSWPENFWTLACEHDTQILLTKGGVFKRNKGEKFQQLCPNTPPLGRSILASCAVPMLFNAVRMPLSNGEVLTLHDGALSWEGWRPVTIVEDHYGVEPESMIVCDVGPETTLYDRASSSLWKVFCGGRCVATPHAASNSERNYLLIRPVVTSVGTFEFTAPADRKWEGIMEGFAATFRALSRNSRLTHEEYLAGRDILNAFDDLRKQGKQRPPSSFTRRALALLAEKGVLRDGQP
ncbi:MAG: patatin-like phospholipase family protein [Cyanobacteria bacterium SZAS TMP-1]|nr:patatin-like phospholipase family protein [Cyanobacteria bacterium SZAS TMP-1]